MVKYYKILITTYLNPYFDPKNQISISIK